MATTTTTRTEIFYRGLSEPENVKRIVVHTDEAEAAIDMIRGSDTLEFCAAYPIED